MMAFWALFNTLLCAGDIAAYFAWGNPHMLSLAIVSGFTALFCIAVVVTE